MKKIFASVFGLALLLLLGGGCQRIDDEAVSSAESQEYISSDQSGGIVTYGEPRENFNHILQSATHTLLHDFGPMAMVEHCPGGYTLHENPTRSSCTNPQERSLAFVWLDGTVVTAPRNGGADYLDDRTWEGGSTFQSSLTPDFTSWMYVEHSNPHESVLWAFHTRTGKNHQLMSFTSPDDRPTLLRFVGVNETGTHFAVLIYREQHATSPQETTIALFDLTQEPFAYTHSYTLSPAADWSPNNGPFFLIDWHDEDTLVYVSKEDLASLRATTSNQDDDVAEAVITLFGDISQRNQSPHLRYLDIATR